jgi:ABC-2 type transport system ATP-binding protein
MSISAKSETPAFRMTNLTKTFRVHERQFGIAAALKSLVNRKWKEVKAVQDVSFEVAQGEIVGFLGPNGAGKTTTIKMLSGLLYPTAGEVHVLGHVPWRREKKLLQQITLVMGRRNQLIWDVPAIESFEFFRAIYGTPRADYKQLLDELVSLLGLEPLLYKPVRNLSLGERMKCELAGSLLHRPRVLFLDEPTIGLDVLAQHNFREFIAEYNRRYNATILLTSHYMGDVEALCQRVIFIESGKLLFEGGLKSLVERFLPYKTFHLKLKNGMGSEELWRGGEILSRTGKDITLRVPKDQASHMLTRLVNNLSIEDFTVVDPPVSDVVKYVYSGQYTKESLAFAAK